MLTVDKYTVAPEAWFKNWGSLEGLETLIEQVAEWKSEYLKTGSLTESTHTPSPAPTQGGGPLHIWLFHRFSKLKAWMKRALLLYPWRYARLHGFVLELHSLSRRILSLRSTGYKHGVETGFLYERLPNGLLGLNRKTQSRSDCIQKLRASRPWLAPTDLELVLLGWEEGYRFGVSPGNGTPENTA